MDIEYKICVISEPPRSMRRERVKNPSEIFLNEKLLSLAGALGRRVGRSLGLMSDYEKFALVCSLWKKGRGTSPFVDFFDEIFCLLELFDEGKIVEELRQENEIGPEEARRLWRHLCKILGNVDNYCDDEKNNYNKSKKIYIGSKYYDEKTNNIRRSVDIERILSEIGASCENIEEFVGSLIEFLEFYNIFDIIMHIDFESETAFVDKYHCGNAYKKYIGGGSLSSDEKYSLYYGITYLLLSKYNDRKIQLNILFSDLINADEMLMNISKSFSNECVFDSIRVGFCCDHQEKNIAEYFYSANFAKGIFPIFDCVRYGNRAELFISLLRLSKVIPLEYVTFICGNDDVGDLLEFAKILSLR